MKYSSLPSARQRGELPPSVETCHARPGKWPHVNFEPARFVRIVGHPLSIRRKCPHFLLEGSVKKREWLSLTGEGQDHQVAAALPAFIEDEPSIGRPRIWELKLIRLQQEFLFAQSIRCLPVQIHGPRPVGGEYHLLSVRRPDLNALICGVRRETSAAHAFLNPDVRHRQATPRHGYAPVVGRYFGIEDKSIRRTESPEISAVSIKPNQLASRSFASPPGYLP
jgi:hypothetical protein